MPPQEGMVEAHLCGIGGNKEKDAQLQPNGRPCEPLGEQYANVPFPVRPVPCPR
jgi:hypothetical protein